MTPDAAYPPMTGSGGYVVISGQWLAVARNAALLAARELQRNGLPASDYGQLAEALRCAMAATGQRIGPEETEETQWVSTKEAARLMECSERQARRIAAGCGHRVGGRWVIPAGALRKDSNG